MDRNDRILKVTDPETGQYLCKILTNEGVHLISKASPARFQDENTLIFNQDGKEEKITADYFFIATGRVPNIKGMKLENAGVEYSSKGISTNNFLQTTTQIFMLVVM